MTSESEVVLGLCCFCAQPVDAWLVEPCRVTVETQAGNWQVWYCHARCFKSRLASLPDAPDIHARAVAKLDLALTCQDAGWTPSLDKARGGPRYLSTSSVVTLKRRVFR